MRISKLLPAATVSLALLGPEGARAQIPQGLLQQLLPGNQGQNQGAEQAVREAYERGYRQGRQDQERSDQDRSSRMGPQGGNQNQGYNRNPYGR